MKKLSISKKVLDKFPKLNLGIVIAKNIDNKGSDEKIYHLIQEIEDMIKLDFTPEAVAKHPLISPWRTAYSEFGSKPSSYHCSVESLMKNILKEKATPKINKSVDISNYLSLKHLVPMGVQDIDKIKGNISLTLSKGTETFVPLGSKNKESPDKGEVIYKDSDEVLCRRWNWRDSEKAKVDDTAKNVIYYIDALPPVNKAKIKEILRDIIDLLNMFCKPEETSIYFLDKDNADISF
jgi:lysyl-tRNA synthetase class 2